MVLVAGFPDEGVRRVLLLVSGWSSDYWWLVVAIAGAYMYATCWYWGRLRGSDDKIRLAPISVKGGISKELGAREVGLILRTQLEGIRETFRKATGGNVSDFAAEAVATHFPSMNLALVDAPLELVSSELKIKEEFVVSIGQIKVPLGAIINLIVAVLRVLPVPFRKRYLASLFHISVISVGNETQLLIYRKGSRPVAPINSKPEVLKSNESIGLDSSKQNVLDRYGSWPMLLARNGEIKGVKEFNDLLRDAAFMLLQMHGGFEGRNWLGMRRFADGLEALDKYRQTTKDEWLKTAKVSFGQAVAADVENYEAAYFYGYMLLFERTRESIAMAIRLFRRALMTDQLKLKALVNTGLAHCYAQQFHRLARRKDDILLKAASHAEEARGQWMKATGSKTPHPLTLYVTALCGIADEGVGRDDATVRRCFGEAADELLMAIELEPDNAMFHNTLGWLYLKLAEREDVKDDGISPELAGSPTERAMHYIRISLDLNPQDKLSHANLCLLYATPRYRADKDKAEEYLIRCRYHGLKAIQLDPKYINGHRDLALSLIRYGEFDEAEKYFKKALRFAAVVDKDLEIIEDTLRILDERKTGEEIRRRFAHPDPELLVPPP